MRNDHKVLAARIHRVSPLGRRPVFGYRVRFRMYRACGWDLINSIFAAL